MSRNKRIVLYSFIVFAAINLVSFFHAYKFTHFDSRSEVRTGDPNKLSAINKIATLVFGIDNPRPVNTERPNLPFETVKINFKDDLIECWHVPVDSSKGTILIFHGYAGNKSQMTKESNLFNELGYSTILIDFLGSGGSTGNRTTIGFYESDQVKCVYDFFKDSFKQEMLMFGTSMGAVAIMKSIHDYELKPKAIIIECPFGYMLQTVQARFKIMNAPDFPMSHLLVFWGGVMNNFNAFGHNPIEYAKNIDVKTLLLYGLKDNKVSKEEIDLIFGNLQGPKKLRMYKEAGHEAILTASRAEWKNDVSNFLDE